MLVVVTILVVVTMWPGGLKESSTELLMQTRGL